MKWILSPEPSPSVVRLLYIYRWLSKRDRRCPFINGGKQEWMGPKITVNKYYVYSSDVGTEHSGFRFLLLTTVVDWRRNRGY